MTIFRSSKNLVYIALGWVCLALGTVGIFLPLLPTTPFVLLAAFFFSKGSEKLYHWLLRQPTLGPLIIDWQRDGVIKIRAKLLSTALIIPLFAYTLVSVEVGNGIKAMVGAIGVAVLCFIWSRPSQSRMR